MTLLLWTVAVPGVSTGTDPSTPSSHTIESARERLQFLTDEESRIGEWVERNWEKALSASQPGIVTGPRRKGEKAEAFRERDMRLRMAVSAVKERLRTERKVWILNERGALLASEFQALLPARLGAYDAGREEYPLLLGFGWPSDLFIRFRVPEEARKLFELRLTGRVNARFRINGQGEAYLVSLGKFWKDSDGVRPIVYLSPPGPRLLWEGSHESWVSSVAFRPDGSQALSAGADGTLCIWDVATGARIACQDNVEMALSVAYSPDGSTFATGGADSYLRIRDAADGREISTVPAGGRVLSVGFSPDGRYVVTGDGSGAARVFSASSGKEAWSADFGEPVWSAVFAGGGTSLAAGGDGNTVVLWNILYQRRIWKKELEWPIYSLAVAGNRGLVAVGGAGRRMLVLREKDGSVAWSADMGGEVRTVAFDPSGGKYVAGGGGGYAVKVFAPESGKLLWTAEIGNPIRSLAFGPEGGKLFVGSSDFSVRMFEVTEEQRVVAAYWSPGRIWLERGTERSLFRP
ncbi:MAG: WD40 repeat domain-containing protein [Deltaproteobacteria bacterium]|nr:WD40 repeat domain-containing protein [Deltaproteobacteria bacterium]